MGQRAFKGIPGKNRPLKKEEPETKLQLISALDFQRDFRTYKTLARHKKEEESESNWLVSYADMMTLLVGFFVMLMAFSKVDSSKFEEVKRETTKVFGGEYILPFEKVSKALQEVVKNEGLTDQVLFKESDEGILITFRGALFFESGSSELREQALTLLNKLVPTIKAQTTGFGIVVEGHTDNVKISSDRFPSNWELSSVRASTVLRLFESSGFPREKLKAIGWGDTRPIVPNSDDKGVPIAENQSQNRRVVIRVIKEFEE